MIKNCSNCAYNRSFECTKKYEYYCNKYHVATQYGDQPLVYLTSNDPKLLYEAIMSRVIPIAISLDHTTDAEKMIVDNTKREAMLKSDAIWVSGKLTNDEYYDIEAAKQSGIPVYYLDDKTEFPKNQIVFEIIQDAYQIGRNEDVIKLYNNGSKIIFQDEWNPDEIEDAIIYDTTELTQDEKYYLNRRLEKLPFALHEHII